MLRAATAPGQRDPRLAGAILRIAAFAWWDDRDSIRRCYAEESWYVSMVLGQAENCITRTVPIVSRIADTDEEGRKRKESFFSNMFSCSCQVILAILRLQNDVPEFSKEFGRRLQRLSALIRRNDSLFARRHIPVVSRVRFANLQKPTALHAVSDIAFATNAFLSGSELCRHVELRSEDDE
jgi:hypothetical protein